MSGFFCSTQLLAVLNQTFEEVKIQSSSAVKYFYIDGALDIIKRSLLTYGVLFKTHKDSPKNDMAQDSDLFSALP